MWSCSLFSDQPLSPGIIAGIVLVVLLVMVVMAASVYLFINRKMYVCVLGSTYTKLCDMIITGSLTIRLSTQSIHIYIYIYIYIEYTYIYIYICRIPWVLCIYLNICYLVDWVINTNLVENLKSLYSKRGSLFHAKMGLNLCQDVEKYVNSSPSLPLPLFLFHILSLSHTLQAKYFSITFRHNW